MGLVNQLVMGVKGLGGWPVVGHRASSILASVGVMGADAWQLGISVIHVFKFLAIDSVEFLTIVLEHRLTARFKITKLTVRGALFLINILRGEALG